MVNANFQELLLHAHLELDFSWIGITLADTSIWATFNRINEWRLFFIYTNCTRRKSFASLIM
jgi:hypothetical protein